MSTPTDEHAQGIWLTQEAHDRLKAELDQLVANRPVMSAEINARREEGDLRENGGYHAAKEEQGKQEARIRQLRQLLDNAKVGEAPASTDGTIAPGMVVSVDLLGDEMTFLLGSREVAGDTDLDVYSEKSPLGSAILGRKPGDSASYTAPNGKEISLKILSAEPFTG